MLIDGSFVAGEGHQSDNRCDFGANAAGDVNLITMTGNVPTGKRIMSNAAKTMALVSLELGGKAPFIVMADSDLDMAVRSAVTSRYMNCGQVCICNERILVQRPVYDEFIERFIAESKRLRIGDPLAETTDIGPKFSQEELVKIEQMVQGAIDQGAQLQLGGAAPDDGRLSSRWSMTTIIRLPRAKSAL